MSSALISNTNDKVAQGSKPALHGVWLRRLTGACLLLLATLSLHAQSTTNCTSFDDLKAFIAVNDSVEFDCDGTISFTDPISITHAVVIDGGSNRVTLSGNNITRLFSVAPGGSLTLLNLTVANGRAGSGGAIVNNGRLEITDCAFMGNTAAGAKGVDGATGANGSNAGNSGDSGGAGANSFGGAIYNLGTLIATRCAFGTNSATGGDGGKGGAGGNGAVQGGTGGNGGNGGLGQGGAIFNGSIATIVDCTFERNTTKSGTGGDGGAGGTGSFPGRAGKGGAGAAASGAGIHNAFRLDVSGSTFERNVATAGNSKAASVSSGGSGQDGPPGGDSFGGGIANFATAFVVNSTFSTNKVFGGSGGNGGTGDIGSGDGGNGGSGYGGSFYNNITAGLTNCTFSGGSARGGTNGVAGAGPFPGKDGSIGFGRGGNVANTGSSAVLKLKNNIIAQPSAGGNGYGTMRDLGYNISSDASIAFTGIGSWTNVDPLLRGLANYGGPTETFALKLASPAINHGDPDFSPATDQRGVERDGQPDRGAYEFALGTINVFVGHNGDPVVGVTVTVGTTAKTTDDSGSTSFTKLPIGTYTVTPSDPAYQFDPPSATIEVKGDTSVEFEATPIFFIGGQITSDGAGVSNVVVTAGGTTIKTDTNGVYRIGPIPEGDYTVQPVLDGMSFSPQGQVVSLHQDSTNVDFTATGVRTISGQITDGTNAVPGVTVMAGNKSATTDANGNFAITDLGPYSYNVTPVQQDRGFVPPSRSVSVQSNAVLGVNFTAFPGYSLAGSVINLSNSLGVAGVTLTLVNANSTNNTVLYSTLSATNGSFQFSNVVPATYFLRPALTDFAFLPASNTVVIPSSTNVNFGAYQAYSLSGQILSGSEGLSNAVVTATIRGTANAFTVTTDEDGNYTFPPLLKGSYDVAPKLDGYKFSPATNRVTLTNSTSDIDFTALGNLSISGNVLQNSAALTGVRVTAGGAVNFTDTNGAYTLTNLGPGTYTVTPSLTGHGFDPASTNITLVNSSTNGVSFAGYLVFKITGKVTAGGDNLAGVTVTAGTNSATTDNNGVYTIPSLRGGTYTVTPQLAGYTFQPPSTTTNVNADVIVNFTAPFFTLGGRITEDNAGLPGINVTVEGKTSITDSNGYYRITSLGLGMHRVTPSYSVNGYQFFPGFQDVDLQGNNTNVSFTANGTFSISGRITEGTAGLSNVTVRAGTKTAITDRNGNYILSELGPRQYAITPSLAGYAFTPAVTNLIITNSLTSIDFAAYAAFTVDGRVGYTTNSATAFTNVLMTLTNTTGTILTTRTATNGTYSFTNVAKGDFTVFPTVPGYAFGPVKRTFTLGPNAASGMDFSGYPVFAMSGRTTFGFAALTNVTITVASNGVPVANAFSDVNGDFNVQPLGIATYTLTPSLSGYSFTPANRSVVLTNDVAALNFSADGIYSIGGLITEDGAPISGVAIAAGGKTTLSDVNGQYSIGNLPPGTHTVVPSLARHSFEPPTATVVLGPSKTGVDFRALQVYTISGRVTENGGALSGVTVSAGGRTNITDVNGNYSLSGVPSGTNMVRASLNGYEMTPAQQQIVLNGNQTGIDFSGRGLFYIRGRIIDSNTSNGVAGVTITAGRYSAANDSAGFYTITNMGPGAYVVVPTATGRGFGPGFVTVTLAPSANDVDFISFPVYKLSGRVMREGTTNPIPSVAIRAASQFATNTVLTDPNGFYNFAALREANYTVTPSLAGNSFEPTSLDVGLFSDTAGQDFVGFIAFTISGRITEGGLGVPGVEVTAAGSTNPIIVAVTDNAGNYTVDALRPDTYSLYPVRPGYDITPQTRNIKVGPSTNNVNFTAVGVLTISGTFREGSATLTNITVVLTSTNNPPINRSAVSDTRGSYIFTNLSPRTYVLTPRPSGVFNPASPIINLLDHTVVDFDSLGGKLSILPTSTNVVLRLLAVPNRNYPLQSAVSPVPSAWSNHFGINFITDSNGLAERREATNSAFRFFRTRR